MNFNTITIIGTGTLGGHLCKHLAESSKVNKLIIIDKDIVDAKDTEIGIFNPVDIYEPKVHVLYHMFLNYNIEIEPRMEFYIENNTSITSDLIIDCRNIFRKRDLNIDMKMFISERFLILDFQKKYENKDQLKGEYSIKLSKNEISRAAYYASDLICSDVMIQLLKRQSIKYIDIDIIQSLMLKNIHSSKEKSNIIYDLDSDIKRLSKLDEVIQPILKQNKKTSLKILSRMINPNVSKKIPEVAKTTYQVIPQNSLKQPKDVIDILKKAIQDKNKILKFLPVLIDNEIHILQDTGGA